MEEDDNVALLARGKKGKGKKQASTSGGGGKGKGKQGEGLFQSQMLELSEVRTLCSCVSREEEGNGQDHGNILPR